MDNNNYFAKAIFFGMLSPLLISLFVAVSRYTAMHHQYSSTDLHMDTMFFFGLLGCPLMGYFWATHGYTSY